MTVVNTSVRFLLYGVKVWSVALFVQVCDCFAMLRAHAHAKGEGDPSGRDAMM